MVDELLPNLSFSAAILTRAYLRVVALHINAASKHE